MIGRGFDRIKDSLNDKIWCALLRRHDFTVPPSTVELSVLESRILTQIDALPQYPTAAGFLPSWISNPGLSLRSASIIAVLFIALGFLTGRSFDIFFQSADPAALFASAGSTPWQSFLTAPSSSGEFDDASE